MGVATGRVLSSADSLPLDWSLPSESPSDGLSLRRRRDTGRILVLLLLRTSGLKGQFTRFLLLTLTLRLYTVLTRLFKGLNCFITLYFFFSGPSVQVFWVNCPFKSSRSDLKCESEAGNVSDLPRRRLDRPTLVDEPLDLGVLRSPPSEGVASLTGAGIGPASWITMMSSLLCWPRCSLAKSKPLTLGACS